MKRKSSVVKVLGYKTGIKAMNDFKKFFGIVENNHKYVLFDDVVYKEERWENLKVNYRLLMKKGKK